MKKLNNKIATAFAICAMGLSAFAQNTAGKSEDMGRICIAAYVPQQIDKMPDADMGLEFLRKAPVPTVILSSTANEVRYDAIAKQKMIWLQKYGITFNPIFVPGKRLKQQHAAPDRILIDDTESVIDQWNAAGGIGILHKDWETTITILKMYV